MLGLSRFLNVECCFLQIELLTIAVIRDDVVLNPSFFSQNQD